MSGIQRYTGSGEPVTLHILCRDEPAWAASRIRVLEAETSTVVAAERERCAAIAAMYGSKTIDGLLVNIGIACAIRATPKPCPQCSDGKWIDGNGGDIPCPMCTSEELNNA